MRMFWGLLGAVLSVGLTWMIQTGRLHGGQAVPGAPGTNIADLDPRKIIASLKSSVGKSDARLKNVLEGELSPDQQMEALARVVEGDPSLNAGAKNIGSMGRDSKISSHVSNVAAPSKSGVGQDLTRALSPSGAVPGQKVYRYSMDIQRVTEGELQPYLGDWISQPPSPTQYLHLQIQPLRAISNVSVRVPQIVQTSLADNNGLLWKDVNSGRMLVALNNSEYILLEGTASPLKATLFQRGNVGTTYHRVLEYSLVRTTQPR